MHSIILDFKTDGLNPAEDNILGASYNIILNSTSESIGSYTYIIKPQKALGEVTVAPANQETLNSGININELSTIFKRLLKDKKITNLIIANIDFDLAILVDRLGVDVKGLNILDLNTDLPVLTTTKLDAVNKGSSFDVLEHMLSMYRLVKQHTVKGILDTQAHPKLLFKVDTRGMQPLDITSLIECGFTYNSYYDKHIAFYRLSQLESLLKAISNRALPSSVYLMVMSQYETYLKNSKLIRCATLNPMEY